MKRNKTTSVNISHYHLPLVKKLQIQQIINYQTGKEIYLNMGYCMPYHRDQLIKLIFLSPLKRAISIYVQN